MALASYPAPADLEELNKDSSQRNQQLRRNHNFLHHAVGSAGKPFLAAAALTVHPRLAVLNAVCFSEITPERVNLRTNLIQHLRQDLYTLLLGAGSNRWSNLQLAQAMARVMTGRPVKARILERVEVPAVGGTIDPEKTGQVLWDLEAELANDPEGWTDWDDQRRKDARQALTRVREAVKEFTTSHISTHRFPFP